MVEDNALEQVARTVARNLRIAVPKNSVRLMDGDDLAKGKKLAQALVRSGCQSVIVLKDRLGPDFDIEERFQQVSFPRQCHLVVAEKEAESWFLADHEAIAAYLRHNVNLISNPEAISDPKQTLKDVFMRHRRTPYLERGRDPLELAQRLRPDVVASRCPSFQRFLDAIQS